MLRYFSFQWQENPKKPNEKRKLKKELARKIFEKLEPFYHRKKKLLAKKSNKKKEIQKAKTKNLKNHLLELKKWYQSIRHRRE